MKYALCLLLVASPAWAGKLTDAQAKKAATDWIAAMHFGAEAKLDAAIALTASPLWAAAYDDTGSLCGADQAPGAEAIRKLLGCLQQKIRPSGKPKVWTTKSATNLGGSLAQHAKHLAQLKKTMTIVELDEGCDGTENQVILGITKDPKKGVRVAAVLSQISACSE